MSAGRFEWEATRFEYICPETGTYLAVRQIDGYTWHWKVDGLHLTVSEGSGHAKSSSVAKGAARKALEAFKAKRATP